MIQRISELMHPAHQDDAATTYQIKSYRKWPSMNLSKSMSNGTMLTFFLELSELDLFREERIKKMLPSLS
jgi:hypothetical protein